MFSFTVVALALSSCMSATFVPRDTQPEGWLAGYLEPYDTYHARYLALSCKTKHETEFFDHCCHPLLATEKLSSRPAECDPANLDASGTESDDDDLPYCDEDAGDVDSGSSLQLREITSETAPINIESQMDEPATTSTTEDQPIPTTPAVKQVAPSSKLASGFPHLNVAAANAYTGGFATWFFQNGVAGACGTVHRDDDYIAAIDGDRYGNLGERSYLCGRRVQVTNTRNGKFVSVYIADACPTCRNANSIDLSVGAFQIIAPLDEGIVPIEWKFIS